MRTAKHTSQLWLAKTITIKGRGGIHLHQDNATLQLHTLTPDKGTTVLYKDMSLSMAPSRISRDGRWGRKSFPTKKHMKTQSSIALYKERDTQHRTSLSCYTMLKLHIGDFTLQLTLVSGGSKHYAQVWFLRMFKCFNAITWWCTCLHPAWTLPGWTAFSIHAHYIFVYKHTYSIVPYSTYGITYVYSTCTLHMYVRI